MHSADVAYGIEACWRHLRGATEEQRYRGFLAFWTACSIQALSSGAQVIDAKKTATDAVHRQHAEAALAAGLGQAINLESRTAVDPYRAAWLNGAHQAASVVVSAHGGTLSPDRLSLVLGYLDSAAPKPLPARPRPPRVPDAPTYSRTRLQRLVTSAAVIVARALQPIRRVNGALTRPA